MATEKKQKKIVSSDKSLKEIRAEYKKLKLDIMSGKEKNTSLLRKMRKQIVSKIINK